MGITVVTTLRVMPGKQNELFENLRTIKKTVERARGTYSVRRQVAGPMPNTIVSVAEYPDWSGQGKARSDPEFLKLMEKIRNSATPTAEVVITAIFEDVTI